tara:strand:+ start:513 stop:734 length:222 start_codon:yes stop_codon:yes gene_type:complete
MDEITKEQQDELKRLANEMAEEAKKVREDYKSNPSEMSGSVTQVHENSPYLKEKHERLITLDGKQVRIKPDVD